jgi:glycine cleavage system H protein
MTKPLVFMMGRSPAFLATDRKYARNHMWVEAVDEGFRLGFSAYAIRLLGDVRRLEWSAEAGAEIAPDQAIGFVEGSKATSDLYAPMGGSVVRLNPAVLGDPPLLNTAPYDAGWLLIVAAAGEGLLSPEQYVSHLEACWPLAERMLKGQASGGDGP